jgi:hypothetical protein
MATTLGANPESLRAGMGAHSDREQEWIPETSVIPS